jgi:hypothetical protein
MYKLNESLGTLIKRMNDSQYRVFSEARRKVPNATHEIQCNIAEQALSGELQTQEAAKRVVAKHNGAASWFTESAHGDSFTENDPFAKADALIAESLGLSEADQRRLKGLPSCGTKLTPAQLREWRFLRSIRLSESDALKGALLIKS